MDETFELLGKVVEKYPYETIVEVTDYVYKNAVKNASAHSDHPHGGRMENNIDQRVSKVNMLGEVFMKNDGMIVNSKYGPTNYALFVHFGTSDHEVKPKKKKALRWSGPFGFAFSKGHTVKGIKADPFMYNASRETFNNLDKIFKRVYDGL